MVTSQSFPGLMAWEVQYLKGFDRTLTKLDTLSRDSQIHNCEFRFPGTNIGTLLLTCAYLPESEFLEDTVTRSS